jgi:hypothetical protein
MFKIEINFTLNKIETCKKQIELIKHTFTNKLASILIHARYGVCRCRRRQDIISRKVIWSRRAIQREIRRILAKAVIKTTIIIRTGEAMHRIKYINCNE